jgi:hypothetical protein
MNQGHTTQSGPLPPLKKISKRDRVAGESLPLPPAKAISLSKPDIRALEPQVKPAAPFPKQNFNENTIFHKQLQPYVPPEPPKSSGSSRTPSPRTPVRRDKIPTYKDLDDADQRNGPVTPPDVRDKRKKLEENRDKPFHYKDFSPNLKKWRHLAWIIYWAANWHRFMTALIKDRFNTMTKFYLESHDTIMTSGFNLVKSVLHPWLHKIEHDKKLNVDFLRPKTSPKDAARM